MGGEEFRLEFFFAFAIGATKAAGRNDEGGAADGGLVRGLGRRYWTCNRVAHTPHEHGRMRDVKTMDVP